MKPLILVLCLMPLSQCNERKQAAFTNDGPKGPVTYPAASPTPTPYSVVCFKDPEGNVTCYPKDPSDKR